MFSDASEAKMTYIEMLSREKGGRFYEKYDTLRKNAMHNKDHKRMTLAFQIAGIRFAKFSWPLIVH